MSFFNLNTRHSLVQLPLFVTSDGLQRAGLQARPCSQKVLIAHGTFSISSTIHINAAHLQPLEIDHFESRILLEKDFTKSHIVSKRCPIAWERARGRAIDVHVCPRLTGTCSTTPEGTSKVLATKPTSLTCLRLTGHQEPRVQAVWIRPTLAAATSCSLSEQFVLRTR